MNDEARQHILSTFIVILLMLCVFSPFLNFPVKHVSAAWWDTDWGYYKVINIANKIDDYSMMINVSYSSGGNVSCESNCNNNFSDIRFLRTDNVTELPYFQEYVNAGTNSLFWFNNTDNESQIIMYYGNAAVGLGSSHNGSDVFLRFNNFETGVDDFDTVYSAPVMTSYGNSTEQAKVDDNSLKIVAFGAGLETNSSQFVSESLIAVEWWMYMDSGDENIVIYVCHDVGGGNVDRIGYFINEDEDIGYIEDAGETILSAGSYFDEWIKFRVVHDQPGDNATIYVYDDNYDLIASATNLDLDTDAKTYRDLLIYYSGTNVGYFDGVFSRLYVYNEPTLSFESEVATPNNKPWLSSPSPVNASIDVSLQPTLSIYVNDTDGESMDITWYEGNYTTLSNITFISNKNSHQGIAVNDTFYWTTGGNDEFHIYKYWVSNDTEVMNRDVETDLPADVNQINGLYLDETNNLLYTGANNYLAGVGTEGWVTVFNADDLTYSAIHSLYPYCNMTEGTSFHNGSWWVVDDFERKVWNFDTSWNHVANYTLSFILTGTIHDGYQGITWYGDDIFVGVHAGVDQQYAVDRYHWNGNGFNEVRRYNSTLGDLPDNCDQGIYYHSGYLYSCMRNAQGAYVDGIAKMELTGWNEIQQNNTINNGTYTCILGNATIYDHTYYWRATVTDGTDTNESWFYFTTEIAPNNPPTQSGESPTDTSTGIGITPDLYVICTDVDGGDTMNATWRSDSSGTWVSFATNTSISTGTNITQPNSNFSSYSTTYRWSINLSDGTNWTNATYSFTTDSSPVQSSESPTNSSTGIGIVPDLYVICTDADSDTMTATWRSNSSGAWVDFASNISISTGTNITQSNSNFSFAATIYWWSINLTDGTSWTNATYHFTTIVTPPNNPPTQSGESPTDTSTGIGITPDLYVICTDVDGGDTMNATWRSDSSGTWVSFATNTGIATGTNITQSFTNATGYSTTYYWSINLSDGTDWANTTYSFTTIVNPGGNTAPTITDPIPRNGRARVSTYTANFSVVVADVDGNFDYTIETFPDVGSISENNVADGVKTVIVTNLAFSTLYTWYINVTDGTVWTNTSYTITTKGSSDFDIEGFKLNLPEYALGPFKVYVGDFVWMFLFIGVIAITWGSSKHISSVFAVILLTFAAYGTQRVFVDNSEISLLFSIIAAVCIAAVMLGLFLRKRQG